MVLRQSDAISMNRYRLLSDAKQKALSLVEGYKVPQEPIFKLPGKSAEAAFSMAVDSFVRNGKATKHDKVMSMAVAGILSGGTQADPSEAQSEDDILALERKAFMTVIRHPESLERVEHVLLTGKPLRN
jgi:3-hydroxyacyl-CoA dehydrogenase